MPLIMVGTLCTSTWVNYSFDESIRSESTTSSYSFLELRNISFESYLNSILNRHKNFNLHFHGNIDYLLNCYNDEKGTFKRLGLLLFQATTLSGFLLSASRLNEITSNLSPFRLLLNLLIKRLKGSSSKRNESQRKA